MNRTRLGLNIFELLFFYLALSFGFLCGYGAAGLLGTGRALAFGMAIGGAVFFPLVLGLVVFASARQERRTARQAILVKGREALRTALREQGREADAIEAEVNRQLPGELLEDKRM